MTDDEIIKALECCIGGYGVRNCDNCPNMGYGCIEVIPRIALDLINRQKAEIERLEHIRKGDEQLIKSLNKCYEQAKSEAIKEFAERLKENVHCTDSWGNIVTVNCIDDFVKEMTDVKEIQHGYNATDKHPVDEFVCSVCGFACQDFTEIVTDEDRDDTWHRECEFSYCPHCGAKVDKE